MREKRLIDADALMKNIGKIPQLRGITYGRMKKAVEETPTIDAVPVVRCRECVCSSMCDDQLICSRIADVMDGYYRGTAEAVKPDDYCSHGIRQKAKPLDGGAEG